MKILDELEQHLEWATPRPWYDEEGEYDGFVSSPPDGRKTIFRPGVNNPQKIEDAGLVVVAINNLDALIAVCRATERVVDHYLDEDLDARDRTFDRLVTAAEDALARLDAKGER